MTRAELFLALLLALATMLIVVPARGAESTRVALATLCQGNDHLAGFVDEAARRYMVPRLHLVAMIWCESRCRPDAIGKAGEVGLLQLHGVAANRLSRRQLLDQRTNILTGARWLSLREVDCGGQVAGLSGYNSRTCRGGKRYARRVMAVVSQVRRAIQQRTEPRP
jgi:soluble lytic murein transglycosylase-like protein